MKAKNSKVSKVVPQARQFLYIGTNEQVAKISPVKGLEPPIYLTDVYPGFFCKQNCHNGERWGIISVRLDQLFTGMFAPSPTYLQKHIKSKKPIDITNHKTKWDKSLNNCGVCVYTARIPPSAIHKVMIYTPVGRDANIAINNLVNELPIPDLVSPTEHKALYSKSLGVLKWFNGEPVRCEDIFNGQTNIKIINEFDNKLNNRFGLDVYYIRPEEKKKNIRKEENN